MRFLPPLDKVERELRRIGVEYDPTAKERLEEIKGTVPDICYNGNSTFYCLGQIRTRSMGTAG